MKFYIGLLILICWAAGVALAEPRSADEQGLLLPGFQKPLRPGMSMNEVFEACPGIAAEGLANGAILCEADVGFSVKLLLVSNQLLDIRIESVKPRSKVGKLLAERITLFSLESTAYETTSLPTDSSKIIQNWTTPTATWSRVPAAKRGHDDYTIRYPTELTALWDGMIIRVDSLIRTYDEEMRTWHRDGIEVPPQPVSAPSAQFPLTAVDNKLSGRVTVQVLLDTLGNVHRWQFVEIEPLGFGFAQEVQKVILDWTFAPATIDGRPVAAWIQIPFNFKYKNISIQKSNPFWPKSKPRNGQEMHPTARKRK